MKKNMEVKKLNGMYDYSSEISPVLYRDSQGNYYERVQQGGQPDGLQPMAQPSNPMIRYPDGADLRQAFRLR